MVNQRIQMDESKENILPEVSSWKMTLARRIEVVLIVGVKLFGIYSFTEIPVVYELYLSCWVVEIVVVTFGAFYTKISQKALSLDSLMNAILFLVEMMAHLLILFDSWSMQKNRQILRSRFTTVLLQVQLHLKIPLDPVRAAGRFSLIIASVTIGLIFCHIVILWTVFQTTTLSSTFYWYMLPSAIALQFKMLQMFAFIIHINEMLLAVHRNMNTIGERNLERIFKPLSDELRMKKFVLVTPYAEDDDDEVQLITIMNIYSELYVLFKMLSEHFGWSLLGMTALYFIDFVCNSYWVFLAIITQGRDLYALVQNIGLISMVLLMLSALCWNCQKTFNVSRSIGCLIFKMVKPKGHKRYNSLVSDFSLQTLHQRFIVTAKDFFTIDLNLLGSMVAAIVTYLVILIQMMYTAKNDAESLLTTKVLIRTTMMPVFAESTTIADILTK